MPFYPTGDGSCIVLDWKRDKAEITARNARGEAWFPTLGGAILYGGVQATAFDQPLKAEPVYNAQEALSRPLGTPLPDPVGVVSSYRVCVFNGELVHPPASPADLPTA
jgi:hypothetical protein